MLVRLLLLFTLLPLAEFALLVQVERLIGLWSTIAMIVATGLLGGYLARREGLRTIKDLKTKSVVRGLPSQTIAEGVLVLVAAAVLLTPGILTDVTGFLLLVPAVRRRVAWTLVERGKQKMADVAKAKVAQFKQSVRSAGGEPHRRKDVIDVEFEPVDRASAKLD